MQRKIRTISGALVGLFISFSITAQQPSEADLQRLQAQAQEMQACFAKVDQTALADLRARGESVAADINALCAANKRDEAQRAAQDYARTLADEPVTKSLAGCGEMAQQMMQTFSSLAAAADPGTTTTHVCDAGR
jgi:hypothetical protein